MYDFDHQLFLALNFDGGPAVDRLMLIISGDDVASAVCADPLARMAPGRTVTANIHPADRRTGPFGHGFRHLQSTTACWRTDARRAARRPMFTPALEGLDIAPDSLRKLRWLTPDRSPQPASPTTGRYAPHEALAPLRNRSPTPCRHARCTVGLGHPAASGLPGWMVFATLLICYFASTWESTLLPWTCGGMLGWAASRAYRKLSPVKRAEGTGSDKGK